MPNPGDYRTTWIGDSPVVVTRAQDGAIHAFVNRCAHRGAQIVRRTHGNADRARLHLPPLVLSTSRAS